MSEKFLDLDTRPDPDMVRIGGHEFDVSFIPAICGAAMLREMGEQAEKQCSYRLPKNFHSLKDETKIMAARAESVAAYVEECPSEAVADNARFCAIFTSHFSDGEIDAEYLAGRLRKGALDLLTGKLVAALYSDYNEAIERMGGGGGKGSTEKKATP